MKNYIKLAAIALAALSVAACTEDKVLNVDVNAIPQVSDYADNFVVTVDQATNNATFTFTGQGAYPVWIIDGKTYSTNHSVTKYYRKRGEYSVEAKIGNANGVSDGTLSLPFTIENTKMNGFGGFNFDYEHNLWLSAKKQINSFFYAPGWSQLPDPAYTFTDESLTLTLPEATTDQWQAQCHIGTDICLAAGEHFDGSFIITTTMDLGNAVLKIHPDGDDDDAHSFFPNAKIKTTADEPVTFWFSDLEAAVDMNNLVFTLDFGGNPAGIQINIENFVIKNHIYDDGTELPETPKVQEPDWVDVNSADNIWSTVVPEIGFYYAPGWNQLPNPVPTVDGNAISFELPSATWKQWQAQMFVAGGPAFTTANSYDFKVEFESNVDLPAVTVKFTEDGDDNNFFFTETIKLNAGSNTFWQAALTAPADMAKTRFVFDFGGNPDGTEVTIKNIIVQKHLE